jgi:proline iminopeptidase
VVLAVHGGPGLDLETLDVLNRLAGPTRRLVGYDQRGAGRSTRPSDGDYGLEAQVADLDAVRRWAGVDQIDLVGASWGGLLAAAYTAEHPDRVRSLVLLDAAPLDFQEFVAGERRFSARVRMLQKRGLVPDPVPADRGDSCVPSLTALLPVYLGDPREHLTQPAISSCSNRTAAATFDALRRSRLDALAAALSRYTGPALIVAGANDPFGARWPERIAQLLGAARVQRLTVPGAGHLPYLEQPDQVLPTLDRFLS